MKEIIQRVIVFRSIILCYITIFICLPAFGQFNIKFEWQKIKLSTHNVNFWDTSPEDRYLLISDSEDRIYVFDFYSEDIVATISIKLLQELIPEPKLQSIRFINSNSKILLIYKEHEYKPEIWEIDLDYSQEKLEARLLKTFDVDSCNYSFRPIIFKNFIVIDIFPGINDSCQNPTINTIVLDSKSREPFLLLSRSKYPETEKFVSWKYAVDDNDGVFYHIKESIEDSNYFANIIQYKKINNEWTSELVYTYGVKHLDLNRQIPLYFFSERNKRKMLLIETYDPSKKQIIMDEQITILDINLKKSQTALRDTLKDFIGYRRFNGLSDTLYLLDDVKAHQQRREWAFGFVPYHLQASIDSQLIFAKYYNYGVERMSDEDFNRNFHEAFRKRNIAIISQAYMRSNVFSFQIFHNLTRYKIVDYEDGTVIPIEFRKTPFYFQESLPKSYRLIHGSDFDFINLQKFSRLFFNESFIESPGNKKPTVQKFENIDSIKTVYNDYLSCVHLDTFNFQYEGSIYDIDFTKNFFITCISDYDYIYNVYSLSPPQFLFSVDFDDTLVRFETTDGEYAEFYSINNDERSLNDAYLNRPDFSTGHFF